MNTCRLRCLPVCLPYPAYTPCLHACLLMVSDLRQVEEHSVDGRLMKLLVHRKGSTRAFPPHHPLIPVDYQLTGGGGAVACLAGRHLCSKALSALIPSVLLFACAASPF
jgi:hypothetical protein